MDSVSISQLKMSPSKIIEKALDYPVALENRNKIRAYLVGKELFDKIAAYIEEYIDKKTIKETDFAKGKDFEKMAKKLGI